MVYGNHPCGDKYGDELDVHAKSGVMHRTCPSIIRVYDSDRSNDAVTLTMI